MPSGSYRSSSSGRRSAEPGRVVARGERPFTSRILILCGSSLSCVLSACAPFTGASPELNGTTRAAADHASSSPQSRSKTTYRIAAAGWERFKLSELENDDIPTPILVGALRPAEPEAPVHIRYPEVPLMDHPDVAQYVSYYTKTKRRTIEQALDRRSKVVETVRPIFERRGLPSALIELALLESTFNTDARSSCGSTVGMWQLSASTARAHGLRVDARVDERKDLIRSSEAAASLLEDLFQEFNDWYLAVAAYNSGKGRVQRAIDAGNTRDPFQLAARGLLSETTRQFVARFGALAIVMNGLDQYDFIEPPGNPARQLFLAGNTEDRPPVLAQEPARALAKEAPMTPAGKAAPVRMAMRTSRSVRSSSPSPAKNRSGSGARAKEVAARERKRTPVLAAAAPIGRSKSGAGAKTGRTKLAQARSQRPGGKVPVITALAAGGTVQPVAARSRLRSESAADSVLPER